MKRNEILVYIASPFFNESQLSMVYYIEDSLETHGISFHSPRTSGIIKHLPQEEKEAKAKETFEKDVYYLRQCNLMIAVIDGFDPGTVWEMGHFFAHGKRIATITNEKKMLNIMLRESVVAHLYGINELNNLLLNIESDTIFSQFHCQARDIE